VILLTVVVEPAVSTEIVGAATVPSGVYVAAPEFAGATVAVLLLVEFVVTVTFPSGVNFPVEVVDDPVNVGYDTVPAGVYVADALSFQPKSPIRLKSPSSTHLVPSKTNSLLL